MSLAKLMPYFSQASAAKTPIPPPLVMITTFCPSGLGQVASVDTQLKPSSIVSARNTPICLNAASNILSDPASDPV